MEGEICQIKQEIIKFAKQFNNPQIAEKFDSLYEALFKKLEIKRMQIISFFLTNFT